MSSPFVDLFSCIWQPVVNQKWIVKVEFKINVVIAKHRPINSEILVVIECDLSCPMPSTSAMSSLQGVGTWYICPLIGTGGCTKTDAFLEKFQTAFDPPPSFSKNHNAIFPQNSLKPCIKVHNLQYKSLDWKWPTPPFGTLCTKPWGRMAIRRHNLWNFGCRAITINGIW